MKKFKLKPVALVLIAVIVVAVGAYALFSSPDGGKAEAAAAAPKPALTVTAVQPEQTRLPIKLSANGNIVAWQEAIIGSESSGLRLTQVLVNVGDTVRAGQVLARFSGDSVLADVAQARASLVEAQATAADAAANAARARTLQDSGALSTQQINQYNTAEQTAKARVAAAQAVLDAQQLRGGNTQVLAPDNGVISARSATVGAVVGAGTELFRMIRGGRLEWRAEVRSDEVILVKPGATALVTAASGAQVQGTVRTVAPTVDPVTRNALVYVDLPPMYKLREAKNASGEVRRAGPPQASTAPSGGSAVREATSVGAFLPGMFAQGEFELGTTPALTLPQQALVLRDGFTYAMRIEAGNKVTQVKLETGRRLGDAVEITKGAQAGERYVASGAAFLADGDTVQLVAPAAAAAAPGAEPTQAASKASSAQAATK